MAEKKDKDKKKKDLVSGQASGMSGRDMFLLDPSMISRHSGHDEGEEEGEEFDLNIREEEEDDGVKVGHNNFLLHYAIPYLHKFRRPFLYS